LAARRLEAARGQAMNRWFTLVKAIVVLAVLMDVAATVALWAWQLMGHHH
jgi:hypothetical protein